LLEHFGLTKEANVIYKAVEKAIEFKVVTVDLKPDSKFGTNEVGSLFPILFSAKMTYFISIMTM
jgi:3-isopropylmalate dehydrogenase